MHMLKSPAQAGLSFFGLLNPACPRVFTNSNESYSGG